MHLLLMSWTIIIHHYQDVQKAPSVDSKCSKLHFIGSLLNSELKLIIFTVVLAHCLFRDLLT